jgi:hypothetical protein
MPLGSSRAPTRDQAEGLPDDYLVETGEEERWENEAYDRAVRAGHADDALYFYNRRMRRAAADKRLRAARDQPEPFPGRPEPGGTMTPSDNLPYGSSESYDRKLGRAHEHARQAWDAAEKKLAVWGLDSFARARELENMQRHGLLPPRPVEPAPAIAMDKAVPPPPSEWHRLRSQASSRQSGRGPALRPPSFAELSGSGRIRVVGF